ncbi:hypothetical protein Tco_0245644 [Tanacetum coccineum]
MWSSRFIRYVDTKPNKDQLGKCIEKGPYILTQLVILEDLADGDNPRQPHVVRGDTYINTTPENRKLIGAEAEAIHIILNGIGNDIYSIVDACHTTREVWLAIERLQQGESINKQDVKTKLFWEFGKFTSKDGESIENKGKEIVKPPSPPSESTFEEDSDEEQAQRDKKMQKSLALIAKHFKNIYRPTNNNLRTLSTLGTRMWTLLQELGMTDRLGNLGIRGQKPKRAKDYEYHKERMMLCKKESQGIPLSAEQNEWLQDTDEDPDEQELEAHYMYMEKIQEVLHATDDNSGPTYDVEPLKKVHIDDDYNVFATERQHSEQPVSINNTYVLEKADRNVIHDSSDMCDNEGKADQNVDEPEDERVLLASLIVNFKLDVDKNKKTQKQLKKANTSLTQKLEKKKTRSFLLQM